MLRNELAKMVAALRTATERLDAEKNALADALADVSHQIRTPLTAMGLLIGTAEHARATRPSASARCTSWKRS